MSAGVRAIATAAVVAAFAATCYVQGLFPLLAFGCVVYVGAYINGYLDKERDVKEARIAARRPPT